MRYGRFTSIRVKFLSAYFGIVAGFALIAALISYSYVTRIAGSELARKGTLLGSLLKHQLVELIVLHDLASINYLVESIKRTDSDVLYIVVLDKEAGLLGHTFADNRIPRYVLGSAHDTTQQFFRDRLANLHVRQVVVPIGSGDLGSVIVGLDESLVAAKGNRIALSMAGAFLLMLAPAAVAPLLLSSLILNPLQQILKAFREFLPGRALPVIDIRANDEMKLLADGFGEMMRRISTLAQQSRETQLKMMETERLAGVGVLASGIAHEINNPVAGIVTCAYRLQKIQREGKAAEYTDLIMEAARQIQAIVKDLLNYARRNESGSEIVDLGSLVEVSLKLVKYRLERNKIRLESARPDTPCSIPGSKAQIVQVFVNGLINAIDAIREDGHIRVELTDTGPLYRVSIIDNGTGLTEEVRKRAFDPFFTTKGNRGTGLGLYVSYQIIQEHGGTISLNPEPHGARLEICLPKSRDA